jgi:hypothetical protein
MEAGAVVSSLVCLRETHNHTTFYSSLPLSRPRFIMSLSSTLCGQPFGILLSLHTIYPVATLGAFVILALLRLAVGGSTQGL